MDSSLTYLTIWSTRKSLNISFKPSPIETEIKAYSFVGYLIQHHVVFHFDNENVVIAYFQL